MEYYTTIQGDTWDLMAYKLYGEEKHMRTLYEANWEYADILVFPSGIELVVPDLPEETDESNPFWRQEAEEESYSETEDTKEDDLV